jgi:hypothetical protein
MKPPAAISQVLGTVTWKWQGEIFAEHQREHHNGPE